MITNFILMNGYGLFVWLSFGTVLISCSFVYYKTKKTLKKYEKEFLAELEALSATKKKSVLEKSKITAQILATSSQSN